MGKVRSWTRSSSGFSFLSEQLEATSDGGSCLRRHHICLPRKSRKRESLRGRKREEEPEKGRAQEEDEGRGGGVDLAGVLIIGVNRWPASVGPGLRPGLPPDPDQIEEALIAGATRDTS